MARKSRKRSSRRNRRRRGGAITPASLNSSLAGSWSSRMSAGQGADFFKYHQGQHGGMAPVGAITSGSSLTDPAMRSAAMLGSIDKSMQEIAHMRDAQTGGSKKRKSKGGSKKRKSKGGSHKRKSKGGLTRRRRRTHGGGSASPAPFTGASGMLLSTSEYEKAGLHGGWKTDPAFDAARSRDTM